MFPLEAVVLPGELLPLHIFEDRYRVMIRACLAGDRTFGVILIERGREVGGGDVRVDTGTTAVIEEAAELPDGRFILLCRGADRLSVQEWLVDDPYPQAEVVVTGEPDVATDLAADLLARAERSVRRSWALLSELGASSPPFPGAPGGPVDDPDNSTADRAWQWCALGPFTPLDRLALLRTDGATARLELLCELADAVAEDAKAMLSDGGS